MARTKKSNEEKIIAALNALDASTLKLRKFAERYDEYIDREALRGNDARAKALIKQKIRVCALIEQLETLKSNLELGAFTAQVVSDLGMLPAALEGCRGLLAESPNFSKLGKSLGKIFKDINAPADEIARLNAIFDETMAVGAESTLESRLNATAADENNEAFAAEYAAMMERIKGKVAPDSVVAAADVAADTGNIDIEGIINDENKKK